MTPFGVISPAAPSDRMRQERWDVGPAHKRRPRPGFAKGSQKVRPFLFNPLKSLKTTMGKPCYKLA